MSVYDINGEVISSSGSGKVNITDIAGYYRKPVMKAVEEINSLTDDFVSFVCVTDTHSASNQLNSQNVIRYLIKNSKADKCFHLGDVSDAGWKDEEYNAYFTPFLDSGDSERLFFALGNHELMGHSQQGRERIYHQLIEPKSQLIGNPSRFFYYFDDPQRQIRYMVINTSDGFGNDVSSTQLDWIRANVILPSVNWKLCVFGHIDIDPNETITMRDHSKKSREVTDAIAGTNGTTIGYFCGHEHFDRVANIESKFYMVQFICDRFENNKTFEDQGVVYPNRSAGVTEQAISIVMINTTTGDVKIKRIGAGQDMAYNYKSFA